MSSRQRTTPNQTNQSDLPPKRQGKVVRHDVSKPLQHVSLSRVVNLLTIFAVLFTAFYAYRIVQWKSEAGGWWNLALGRRLPGVQGQGGNINTNQGERGYYQPSGQSGSAGSKEGELESHVHAIASIIGMQPTDLASALSDAVHQHVAPKTISSLSSSISSSASAAGLTAPAANVLLSDNNDGKSSSRGGSSSGNGGDGEGVLGKAGTIAKAVDAVAGFDEPIVAD